MMDPGYSFLLALLLLGVVANLAVALLAAGVEILRLVAADVRQAWENLCRRP